jgi:hypothetical protein
MRRTVAFLVGLSIVAAAPAAQTPAAPATSPTPVAHAACTRAIILGHRKCIARGQYCTHTRRANTWNRGYHHYGYHCGRRDRNGSYHLVYY